MKKPKIGIVVEKWFLGNGKIETKIFYSDQETHKRFVVAMIAILSFK